MQVKKKEKGKNQKECKVKSTAFSCVKLEPNSFNFNYTFCG